MQGDVWRRIAKNGDEVPEQAPLRLLDDAEARYVSRGGRKLEEALRRSALDVRGWSCLDVGQSTGGFTDCLLQHGAASVLGVDVGSGQLHAQLRQDPRVLCVESCNARTLQADDLRAANAARSGGSLHFCPALACDFVPEFDLVVVDLSFISQTLVLPAVLPLLKPGGWLLSLVKPQFELQPGQIGKGGVVRDARHYRVVEARLRKACETLGLSVTDWFDSPLEGGDGNHEFFICACKPLAQTT
jgi:23S rRNA (cytidine1920-2'-O)/16S rRNA (cytidine1409-2'-O)-methyltransferase